MRALLFITYLFALLLTGGNETHANTHTVSNAPISQLKTTYKAHPEFLHSTREHSLPTIVNKDFDLNEEYSSSDICKDSPDFKTAKFKPTVLTKWYVLNRRMIDTRCRMSNILYQTYEKGFNDIARSLVNQAP